MEDTVILLLSCLLCTNDINNDIDLSLKLITIVIIKRGFI